MSEIICIEKLNGERLITEVIESGGLFLRTKNPMIIYPDPEQGKIRFGPSLFTDPQKMTSKLYKVAIAEEYEPSDDILNAYKEYVKMLTSKIIQLDKSIQKVQLNG